MFRVWWIIHERGTQYILSTQAWFGANEKPCFMASYEHCSYESNFRFATRIHGKTFDWLHANPSVFKLQERTKILFDYFKWPPNTILGLCHLSILLGDLGLFRLTWQRCGLGLSVCQIHTNPRPDLPLSFSPVLSINCSVLYEDKFGALLRPLPFFRPQHKFDLLPWTGPMSQSLRHGW
jgi:hypothetical protein